MILLIKFLTLSGLNNSPRMKVVATREALKQYLKEREGSQVGFVPTMGALHDGHLSLVRSARGENSTVVVSIFVNPTQFNDPRDLKSYPRTPEADLELLEKVGTDVVFMPEVEEMYPEPDARVFDFGKIDKVMEGATRPGHFNGVAQVVSRLFEIVEPARAYFGQKDFQQVAVVKAMVQQLGMPVQIVQCPTMREADGLAMSSRNTLLSSEHRTVAPKIYAALEAGREFADSERKAGREITPREVEKHITETINAEPLLEAIYVQLVNAATMQPARGWDEPEGIQACAAVRAGNVRLIDNIKFV